jgi:hypothetical protein
LCDYPFKKFLHIFQVSYLAHIWGCIAGATLGEVL